MRLFDLRFLLAWLLPLLTLHSIVRRPEYSALGTPEDIAANLASRTGRCLQRLL